MKAVELRKKLTAVFRDHGFDSPELEADYIVSEILKVRNIWFYPPLPYLEKGAGIEPRPG